MALPQDKMILNEDDQNWREKIISYCYATFILFETTLSCDLQVINWFFDDYYLGKNHTGVCIYVKFCSIKLVFILFSQERSWI